MIAMIKFRLPQQLGDLPFTKVGFQSAYQQAKKYHELSKLKTKFPKVFIGSHQAFARNWCSCARAKCSYWWQYCNNNVLVCVFVWADLNEGYHSLSYKFIEMKGGQPL